MPVPDQLLRGRIARVNRGGVGYIVSADNRASGSEFVFSFDKIRRRMGRGYAPYRGESLRELGITEGSEVGFSEGEDGMISSVERI